MNAETQGLCWKFHKRGNKYYPILDSAGINTPLAVCINAEEHMKMLAVLKLTEDFIQSLMISLSEYLLFVVNQITRIDQEVLASIIQNRRNSSRALKCREVWVVHNLKNAKTEEQRRYNWDKIKLMFEKVGRPDVTSSDPSTSVEVFLCGTFKDGSSDIHSRHFCLMNDKCSVGIEYNNRVMASIKNLIESIDPGSNEDRDPVETLRYTTESVLKNSRSYILNVDRVVSTLITPEDVSQTTNTKIYKFTLAPVASSNLSLALDTNTQPGDSTMLFKPKSRIFKDENENYCIELQVAGCPDIAIQNGRDRMEAIKTVVDKKKIEDDAVRKLSNLKKTRI